MFSEDYKSLVEAISSSDRSEETIRATLKGLFDDVCKFSAYVDSVVKMRLYIDTEGRSFGAGAQGNDFISTLDSMNRDRSLKHTDAIRACTKINRLCDEYGVKHICTNQTDRSKVANFCGIVVNEMFLPVTKFPPEVVQEVSDCLRSSQPDLDLAVMRIYDNKEHMFTREEAFR